jgi:hypothetical protein
MELCYLFCVLIAQYLVGMKQIDIVRLVMMLVPNIIITDMNNPLYFGRDRLR